MVRKVEQLQFMAKILLVNGRAFSRNLGGVGLDNKCGEHCEAVRRFSEAQGLERVVPASQALHLMISQGYA